MATLTFVKILVNDTKGNQPIYTIQDNSRTGYRTVSSVLWDERSDGPLVVDATSIGGYERVVVNSSPALTVNVAKLAQYIADQNSASASRAAEAAQKAADGILLRNSSVSDNAKIKAIIRTLGF